jgi:hypothetical protein
LPGSANVHIDVYNMSGQKVGTVTDAYYPPGEHEVEFYSGALPDGMYFYKLTAGALTGTAKLFVLKH